MVGKVRGFSVLLLLLFLGVLFLWAEIRGEYYVEREGWDVRLCDEWNIWLDSCGDRKEKEMMLAAFSELEKVMEKGSVFKMSSFDQDVTESMYSTPDFPESGYRLISGRIVCWNNGEIQLYDSVSIAIVVQENQTYEVYNNHAKRVLASMLEDSGIKFKMSGYTCENRAQNLQEAWQEKDRLGDIRESIFISYQEYQNIPDFFEKFQAVCKKMKNWQDKYEVNLKQKVRIGELYNFYDTDFSWHASFYPEHELDFDDLAAEEGTLISLKNEVEEDQLAYFKEVEPERYKAIWQGEYISRVDYRQQYQIPFGRHSTVYDAEYQAMGYRGGEWKGMSQNSKRYRTYLKELIQNKGLARDSINEEFPEYRFSSGEKEKVVDAEGNIHQWSARYNDNYCVRFPEGYKYGSSDVCADMIFYEYGDDEKPYSGYTTDMEIQENRIYDMGRLYLFAVSDILDIKEHGVMQCIRQEKVREKIEKILPESIEWKLQGSGNSIYQNYQYAEGETAVKKVSVYIPEMRGGENFQWFLLFEELKDSTREDTLYQNRELIAENFILFPYWYECRPGDTLWKIADEYMDGKKSMLELCGISLNQIENPDIIFPGQRIFIPPHLLRKN